jgi:hypothetical protein
LTLDEDVAANLKAEVRRSGKSFKQTVNELLRRGLNSPKPSQSSARFRVRARRLGLKTGLSYDNVWELIEQLEESQPR